MIVYVDAVFFANMVFDGVLLYFLYRLQSEKIRPFRLVVSAVLGGGFSLVGFVPYFQPLLTAAVRYILPFLMSAVCFVPCRFKRIAVNGIWIFLLSFLISGILNFFGTKGITGILILIPLGFFMPALKLKMSKNNRKTHLFYRNKTVTVSGFCDSGNLLMFGGIPVVLADGEVFEKLFGRGFCINSAYEWVDAKDVKYVPYKAPGRSGVIPGILLDGARVENKTYDSVILGYAGENFSHKLILNGIMV